MNKLNGKFRIYDSSPGSLACDVTLYIEDSTITEIDSKGYPRTNGDSWFFFIKQFKRGDSITHNTLDLLMSYNGKYNIKTKYMPNTSNEDIKEL